MIRYGGWCPDLLGPAGALRRGHETKKDVPMLHSAQFLRRAIVTRKVHSPLVLERKKGGAESGE